MIVHDDRAPPHLRQSHTNTTSSSSFDALIGGYGTGFLCDINTALPNHGYALFITCEQGRIDYSNIRGWVPKLFLLLILQVLGVPKKVPVSESVFCSNGAFGLGLFLHVNLLNRGLRSQNDYLRKVY